MKAIVKIEKEINSPAERVWQILGENFEHIGAWASGIHSSRALAGNSVSEAPVYGRTCTIDGLGDVKEKIINYNNDARSFTFEVTHGLPGFIVSSFATWKVAPNVKQGCMVEVNSITEIRFFPGIMLIPVMKLQGRSIIGKVLEELAYYAEKGELHPNKNKAAAKLKKQHA